MQLARVIGDVVSTMKDVNLTGRKLLVLQPIAASGDASGRTLVALDSVGAGVGEVVFFVRGREAVHRHRRGVDQLGRARRRAGLSSLP